jgi:hypothetical protein
MINRFCAISVDFGVFFCKLAYISRRSLMKSKLRGLISASPIKETGAFEPNTL